MNLKLIAFIVWLVCHAAAVAELRVKLIAFSKNRPLQLSALLESCTKYVSGIDEIAVIYCADESFAQAYKQMQTLFPAVDFVEQDCKNPYRDFKKLLIGAVCNTKATHVIFAVDDIVIIDTIDMHQAAGALERYRAYGVYFRLGKDITQSYTQGTHTGVPTLKRCGAAVYSWRFSKGSGDWAYPHTVDMTLFRKEDLVRPVMFLDYDSPNIFEAAWAAQAEPVKKRRGLCYEYSKIVNLPLNLVQEDFLENRHSGECDVDFLLEKFHQGLKMDISVLHKFPHKAPHAEYMPTFIAR